MPSIIDEFVKKLKEEVKELSTELPDFYDTFNYTRRGRNVTHPITWGTLTKILWNIKGVEYVGVDFRLNDEDKDEDKRIKFQPDLVALKSLKPLQPLLFIDYESPNSSDIRIKDKDIDAYKKWSAAWSKKNKGAPPVPYIIITTLPVGLSPDWELRYTSERSRNAMYKGERKEVQKSPQKFWYGKYAKVLTADDCSNVYFVNLNGDQVKQIKKLKFT